MNNAQKKAAVEAGVRKYLDEGCTLYYHEDRDALIKEAYLQGWNDAEDANERKVTWSSGLLVGKTVAKMEVINDDAELMTLTFTDGSCLCVVYKAYAP